MRLLCILILLLLGGAMTMFALQNNDPITVHFLGRSSQSSPAILLGIIYLLGMVSGWTLIGLVQSSLQRVSGQRGN